MSSVLHVMLQIGNEGKKTVALPLNGERIVIGRGGTQGDAKSLDLSHFGALEYGVSRVHAALIYHDRELYVEDLNSTNGTRINGLSIPPNTPYRIRNGDELEFGSLCVSVRLVTKVI